MAKTYKMFVSTALTRQIVKAMGLRGLHGTIVDESVYDKYKANGNITFEQVGGEKESKPKKKGWFKGKDKEVDKEKEISTDANLEEEKVNEKSEESKTNADGGNELTEESGIKL